MPGTHTVNIIASWYGMTWLSSTQFHVKGDITPVSKLQEKLSTEEENEHTKNIILRENIKNSEK